jgi:hypothetical protein
VSAQTNRKQCEIAEASVKFETSSKNKKKEEQEDKKAEK